MSFLQIFNRITRIARVQLDGGAASFREELRRAQQIIDDSRPKPPRETKSQPRDEKPPKRESAADSAVMSYERASRIVGVELGATIAEITQAYHRRAKQIHPDLRGQLGPVDAQRAHAMTLELNEAYAYLQKIVAR